MRKFIKTVIVVLLVALLAFSVCACKKESDNTSSGSLYATDESSPVSSENFTEKSNITSNESTTSSTPSKDTTKSSNVSSTEKTASLTITTQPKDTTVSAGSKVELSVAVSGGKAPYTYTWQRNSQGSWENITDSADAWSYGDDMLFVMAYKNTWMVNESIRCVVKDADGNSVTSDSVKVILAEPLTITTQPKDATVFAGSKVELSVDVSGGKAPYTYTWQRNSQGSWENITDSADAWSYGDDILFVMANKNTWMVNESIRCVVKDADGNSVTSDSVKVILAEPLTITTQPKDATVSAGSKVELSVAVSGGKAPYTYTWQRNSQGRWENITDSADAWSYGDDMLFVMAYQNTWMVNESIRCVVKDANGNSVTSDSVRVRIG